MYVTVVSSEFMMSFARRILCCAVGVIASLFSLLQPNLSAETHDYCLHESLNASCQSGEVILMTSARYGRMKAGRCISADYGHMGCSRSVIGYLDQQCSGRSACLVSVRDLVDVRPCKKDFMMYLEAKYECIKVPALDAKCPDKGTVQVIKGTSGYVSNVGMTTSPVGSGSCPWKIEVGSGQQINFTFIDFGRDKLSERDLKMFNPCTITIIYSELGERHEVNICDKRSREKMLFVSKTNQVELEITLSASSGKTDFLIKYQAIGCADPLINGNTWLQRAGDNAEIKCNSSEETWFMTCQGSTWIGEVGNCSRLISQNTKLPEYIIYENKEFSSQAMVSAVMIGIVLGVSIGALLLIIVHRFRRKQTKSRWHTASPLMLPRDSNDIMLHFKDLEGSYPALLGNTEEGEGQKVKLYFEDQHHHCHDAPSATCDPFNHSRHRQTLTTSFNQDNVYSSGYLNTGSKNRKECVRTEESPYPPGMRTPQPRGTVMDYIPLKIDEFSLKHGKSCENVAEKLTDIACLPDSSFE